MSQQNVIVVGGGLAGLCCARTLQRAGHIAHTYEASDGVGGRVRTDNLDGFLLDRGFQVLLTAYPAVRQEMDLRALNLKEFDPGALIHREGRSYVVADPFRRPLRALPTAFSPLFGMQDKLNIARLASKLATMRVEQIFRMPDQTTEAFLREFGFTDEILDRFIRPFFGGVFLETELQTSAHMFAFVFKMMAGGRTALPSGGMGELGQQIADDLTPGTLHLNSPVRELLLQNGRVLGVILEDGLRLEADHVVLATPFDSASRLGGLTLPAEWRISTEISFALPEPLYRAKMIALFTEPKRLVNHAAMLTNIAPSYAPPGQYLLSCTVLGDPALSDEELARGVTEEMASRFPQADTGAWRLLRVYRARWAQFAQPAGIWDRLPEALTPRPGLILAGEIIVSSSLHGALVSGQRAAGLAMSVKTRLKSEG